MYEIYGDYDDLKKIVIYNLLNFTEYNKFLSTRLFITLAVKKKRKSRSKKEVCVTQDIL